jgi:lactate dehydrogenase-like 2-hydroxyacid dehydrogenase
MCDVFEDRRDLDEPRARLWQLIAATPHLGDYSFIAFSDFSAPKLWRLARRKVLHNSTGKDERFL